MTKAKSETTEEEVHDEVGKTIKKNLEALGEGQSSIIIDGREVVFQQGQTELPGMPQETRLKRLGNTYVSQTFVKAKEDDLLDKIKQEIMMEIRNEGRASFAMRENGVLYVFNINAPQEKLEVKKKR